MTFRGLSLATCAITTLKQEIKYTPLLNALNIFWLITERTSFKRQSPSQIVFWQDILRCSLQNLWLQHHKLRPETTPQRHKLRPSLHGKLLFFDGTWGGNKSHIASQSWQFHIASCGCKKKAAPEWASQSAQGTCWHPAPGLPKNHQKWCQMTWDELRVILVITSQKKMHFLTPVSLQVTSKIHRWQVQWKSKVAPEMWAPVSVVSPIGSIMKMKKKTSHFTVNHIFNTKPSSNFLKLVLFQVQISQKNAIWADQTSGATPSVDASGVDPSARSPRRAPRRPSNRTAFGRSRGERRRKNPCEQWTVIKHKFGIVWLFNDCFITVYCLVMLTVYNICFCWPKNTQKKNHQSVVIMSIYPLVNWQSCGKSPIHTFDQFRKEGELHMFHIFQLTGG